MYHIINTNNSNRVIAKAFTVTLWQSNKMKIRISDQFLWDMVYPFLSAADNITDFLLSNRYRQMSILLGEENPVFRKYRNNKTKQQFDQLVYYLKKNNYIKVKNLEGKKAIMITKKGLSKVLKASFKLEDQKKREDGKWVMIVFDIPQARRKARNLLRSVLLNLGYKMFQQSVWVTPYNVSEKTEKLLQRYSLDKYIKIFLIEQL